MQLALVQVRVLMTSRANESAAVINEALNAVVPPGATLYPAWKAVFSQEAYLDRVFDERGVLALSTKHKWDK
eukprot:6006084-Lingulodinium_polyedra.AAC.1